MSRESGIAVTNLQDGAALAWASGANQISAISYDTTGTPDPVLLAANTAADRRRLALLPTTPSPISTSP